MFVEHQQKHVKKIIVANQKILFSMPKYAYDSSRSAELWYGIGLNMIMIVAIIDAHTYLV